MKMRNKLLFLGILLSVFNIRSVCSFVSSIICNRVPGLTATQRQLCTESPDAFIALGEGHMLGAKECQHQFKGHRWNCTQVWKADVFSHIVIVGSREAAFTYAIVSAAAVHTIAASCARGNISVCGCDSSHQHQLPIQLQSSSITQSQQQQQQQQQKQPEWKWGGCSADINFGMKFVRKFFDARELEGDARSLMNLHNNRAGRKIVKNLLQTHCKCHGLSGSCSLKTCWRTLPPIRVIGDVLMKKYYKSKVVEAVNDRRLTRGSGFINENNLSLVIKRRGRTLSSGDHRKFQIPKRSELVHLETSPNYCERDLSVGSFGTTDRLCNRTAHSIEGCHILCCGRGYNTHRTVSTHQCNCIFKWCCSVRCDSCTSVTETFSCK